MNKKDMFRTYQKTREDRHALRVLWVVLGAYVLSCFLTWGIATVRLNKGEARRELPQNMTIHPALVGLSTPLEE